jgi:NAD(P)-dependent dehydrogenase (short-subunit alcohol dehydrogenase family)
MAALGLDGKIAVVTGSARGWGRAIALEMAARGVKVVINGRNPATVEATCRAVRELGGIAVGCVADVGTREGPIAVIDAAIEAFGRIDILVNNAGFLDSAPLIDMTDDQWDGVLATQLSAQFRASREAARRMIAHGGGGRIINMVGGGGFT